MDFWGRYRRATEAARADLAATEWAQREVITALIANLARAYFQLRALDLQLEISQRTLSIAPGFVAANPRAGRRRLNLNARCQAGGTTGFYRGFRSPHLEQQIEQEENFISILIGNNPAPVPRGRKLTEQEHPPTVPAGLPSSLLERRPDIRQAEEQLISANAQIGVARAAYFPQISLTATAGYQSSALTSLFLGPAGLWTFGGALTQPIFTAVGCDRTCACPKPASRNFSSPMNRPSKGPFARFPTRWSHTENAGVSSATRTAGGFRGRRVAPLAHAVQRRRSQLSRSAHQ